MNVEETHRLSPRRWTPSWILNAHYARYEWAKAYVTDQRVLDAACGTGYGSAILMKGGAQSVVGLDLSQTAIEEATLNNAGSGVSFQRADILHIPFEASSFDVVVSFETIEHIDDDRRYVEEISRVLRPSGTFLCSTPNRIITNPGTSSDAQPYNPYHVREYTASEFASSLSHRFQILSIMGQYSWSAKYCGFLARLARFSPRLPVRIHQLRKLMRSLGDNDSNYRPRPLQVGNEPEALLILAKNT